MLLLGNRAALFQAEPEGRAMVMFAAISALLHLLLLLLPAPRLSATGKPAPLLPIELVAVPNTVRPEDNKPPPQRIVSPSDVADEREPERPTRFLSERSSRVATETIRHGMPKPAGGGAQAAASLRAAQPASKPTAPRLALNDLFKKPGEIIVSQRQKVEKARASSEKERTGKRKMALALGTVGNLSSFTGGVPDYLPEIRPGQFTLLNAKANLFAPFVRRVGLRVFEHLLIEERRLAEPELLAAQGQAVVRAVLSADGRLVDLKTEEVSGSRGLDQTLRRACQLGAFDHNPPAGARKPDGTYEFVFEARLRPWTTDGQRVGRVDSFLSIRLL